MSKRILLVLVTLLMTPAAIAAPREAASRFVEIWNMDANRSAAYGRVFQEDFIKKRGVDDLDRIFSMLSDHNGDIGINRVNSSSDEEISFLASSATGSWVEITLDLAADDDFKVAGMSIARSSAPISDQDKNLTLNEIGARLEAYMTDRVEREEFSGSVSLAKDGKPVFARAYGLADIASDRKNTLDTPINLGSMNKMFTGLAIAQLVSQGKLDYAEKVGIYLPDYPNQRVRDEVTLHQLLTHTSGMGSYWNDEYEKRKDSIETLQDLLPTFVDEPLLFDPGTSHQYSNSGPVVLGLIIESVTGLSYYEYIRKHVYQPAGMINSGHYTKGEHVSGKANGYYTPRSSTDLVSNSSVLGNIGSPGGGGYSSANDLVRFATALYDGTLIDAEHRKEMTTAKSKSGRGGYGYLFIDGRANGRRYVGHNGGAPGVSAEFSTFPDFGYTVIVLSNTNHNARPVAEKIRKWLGHAK